MLSTRGKEWTSVSYLHGKEDLYHEKDNPNGIVWFTNAENWFMRDDMMDFISSHSQFGKHCCTYGEGYTGTLRLRTAMANHLNIHFRPVQAIDPEDVTFSAGVTDLNEACSLVTCNPGDAIMLGRPVYGPFGKDLALRTGVKLEWVDVGDTDQFSPACAAAYEAEFEKAKARGSNIKALIITNPHNPLGQCYPRETLLALLRFCAAKKIHLISDEIYALSVYDRNDRPSEEFTSVLSIDISDVIDPRYVHVLYGMSKDYAAAGLRLGCVVTRNEDFSKAIRAICRFSSPSQLSMEIAAAFLEDQQYVSRFLQKSHRSLLQSRLLAEDYLAQAGIQYHHPGNAALFIWIDLSPYLPLTETNGDGWAAERLLVKRFTQAGVLMDAGEGYRAPHPGRFRLMFTIDESTLREGFRRLSAIHQWVH